MDYLKAIHIINIADVISKGCDFSRSLRDYLFVYLECII